jgi:cytochrome c oxidase cbb3-type subunit IV
MYRQVLESIDGIGIYPVISLVIFLAFFAAIVVWLLKVDNNYLKKMGSLPLDQSETIKNFTGDNNEI